MTVQASDANTERVFSKGFVGTSWNGTRSYQQPGIFAILPALETDT
jgi:hypothetical protein